MKKSSRSFIYTIICLFVLASQVAIADEKINPVKPIGVLIHPLLINDLQKSPATKEIENWISVVNAPSRNGLPVAIVTTKTAATVDGKTLFLRQASLKETETIKKGTVPVLDVLERRNNWYQVGLYTADFKKYGMVGWIKHDGKGFADISHFDQKTDEKEKK